jgi:hypothetical protein
MPEATNEASLSGGCLCGDISYSARGPWLRFVHCHCSRCRKATGTGHATNVFTAPDHLTWQTGEADLVRFDLASAESFATVFCPRCGSPLPHLTRSGEVWVIPAGSLNDPPPLSPTGRIYWASRTAWSCEGDSLTRYSGQIDEV